MRPTQDQAFWNVVGDLRWKLDDGSTGSFPPHEPEFDHGGGGSSSVWPRWATHVMAFLLGGLFWGALLVAPPLVPLTALSGIVMLVAWASRRRN